MRNLKNKTIFTNNPQIVLASASRTRQEMLKSYGIKFKVRHHTVNEEKLKKQLLGKRPEVIAMELSKAKALSQVKQNRPKELIIGSDQILLCEGKLMSKAKNREEAHRNFKLLNDRKHTLVSAIYIIQSKTEIWKKITNASIFMKKMDDNTINQYLNDNMDTILKTVGGYKIENDDMNILQVIKGKKEEILGFPISDFVKLFEEYI